MLGSSGHWPSLLVLSINFTIHFKKSNHRQKLYCEEKTVHVLSLLKLSPGLHILVHKIYIENFHIVLKCGKCQNNRQSTQTSVDLLGLLTVYALEHWVDVHITPFLASCVIFPMGPIDKKCPFLHSVRKSTEA